MTIYDKSKKKAVVYDYRETGPSNIHPTIYDADTDAAKYGMFVLTFCIFVVLPNSCSS